MSGLIGLSQESHSGLCQGLVALLAVALLAGGNDVLPTSLAPFRLWDDVIERKLR